MRGIYICLLVVMATHVEAQDKIDGIGILKIGKSTPDVVNELAKGFKKGIKEATNQKYEGDGSAVFKLINTGASDAPYQASACPSAEIYYLKKYEVSGIKLTNVSLFFFEGKLIQILCAGSDELDEALTVKYDHPEISSEKKDGDCRIKPDMTYHKTWTNGDIQAQSTSYFTYNANCGISGDRYLSVKLPEKEAEAQECDKQNKNKIGDPKKKDKLKDF